MSAQKEKQNLLTLGVINGLPSFANLARYVFINEPKNYQLQCSSCNPHEKRFLDGFQTFKVNLNKDENK